MGQGVVITGCGVLASNGIGREAFAAALAEGKSGIGDLVSFDASALGREKAAELHGFDVTGFLRSPKNYLDRNSALAFAAAEMALRESGLPVPDLAKGYGLSVGSMGGNFASLALFHAKLLEKGPRFAPPFLFPHTYYNTTAGLLSIEYGLSGPHGQFCSGPAAGMEALAYAVDCIRWGRTDAMLAGGTEAFGESLFRYCAAKGWLSPTDGGMEACRPFAVAGNGAILGEGAAFLCLESADGVRVRKGKVRGRIRGIGMGACAEEAIQGALRDAEVLKTEAVFAAASGRPDDDREEAAAIAKLLGNKPVVALKGLVGETLGTGGPLNLIAALSALESGVLPGAGEEYEAFPVNLVRKPLSQTVSSILVNAGSSHPGCWVSLVVTR
jgi:3-oxoacyl-[acyl-carrier-protein] synthase II